MFARNHSRLHTFILLAFVYQMNVCPCGDLGHNGWYQLAKSYLAPQSSASDLQDSLNSFAVGSSDSHECDEAELAYLVDERVNLESLRGHLTTGHLANTEKPDLQVSYLFSSTAQSDAQQTLAAREMCAQLQVFLL